MSHADLSAALRAYARYAGIVADQLDALDRGDAARQWVLALERDAAEREVATLAAGVELDGVLAAAVSAVGGAEDDATLVRDQIERLEDDARRAARLVPRSAPGAGGFGDPAARRGPAMEAGGRTLDLLDARR